MHGAAAATRRAGRRRGQHEQYESNGDGCVIPSQHTLSAIPPSPRVRDRMPNVPIMNPNKRRAIAARTGALLNS
eukprot:6174999-Pleurochrysis_carterae.AAC.2